MKLLSLYAVIAVAVLVVCCLPDDALGKPVRKKNRGHHDESGRDTEQRRGGGGKGKDRGKGKHHGNPQDREEGSGDMGSGDGMEGHRGNGSGRGNKGRGKHHNETDFSSIRPRYDPSLVVRPNNGPLGLNMDEQRGLNKTKKMKKAMGYMSRFGYMEKKDDWDTNIISEKEMKKSIEMMQKFMGLRETGELDEMTMMMMDKPRCGVPDMLPGSGDANDTLGDPQSYQHFNTKWEKEEITFRILNYPSSGMSIEETRETLLRAFRVWEDVTPITFREVGRSIPEFADFYIKFGIGYHGDDFPFDGRSGTLAHAFLPQGGYYGDLEGDIHFDDDELFTYASFEGTNMFQVAAHEIGHSLGLSHSTVQTALMAPFYPGYQPTFYLPYDDLAGIQSLYGSNPNPYPYPYPYPNPDLSQPATDPPANPPTTTDTPTTKTPRTPKTTVPTTPAVDPVEPEDPCRPTMDATTFWRAEFFAFTEDKYGRLRDYNILSQEGGSLANYFFQNFPGDIDAIYETPITYKLVMFKGPSYYVYEGLMLESGPNPITDLDPTLPSDLDAVVSWMAQRTTYFFKDELVWRFNETTRRVDSGWPYRIDQVWKGLPNKVTGAWHDEEQYLTYFLSGKDYYRYDDLYAEVDVGYPRDFIGDFFGCF